MEWILDPHVWMALAALTALEIVLGIDHIVFSLDSVITAIGLANQLAIMVAAIVIAVLFMLLLAGKISEFVEAHPTIKILALSFLMLIGFSLVGEGFDLHIPKGYIYFAMAFSVFVELLNLKLRKRQTAPIKLRQSRSADFAGRPAVGMTVLRKFNHRGRRRQWR
ncbi:MAG: hypothetical protein R6X10_06215 [Desulfobacterales bacterium]